MSEELTVKQAMQNLFDPVTVFILAFLAFFALTCVVCHYSEDRVDTNSAAYKQIKALERDSENNYRDVSNK